MPRISSRQYLKQQFENIIFLAAITDDDELAEEFLEYKALLLSHRFMSSKTPVPKTVQLRNSIWEYSEREFKQIVRVNRDTFQFIVSKIANHPVFVNKSRYTQRDCWIQALVALEKLGSHGNGASVGRIARSAGVGNGTVPLYVNRFLTAILSLKKEYIKWPDSNQRRRISTMSKNEYNLPNAVGIIDGTHIHLSQKPAIDGEAFWTRKGRYSLNAQIVCDFNRRILYYQVGWPGSIFDQTAFSQTSLFLHPDRYLSPNEYLLGDSGYTASKHMLTPFSNPAAEVPENALFNFEFSKARVIVEHTIGVLKSRWSSLRGIRTQVKKEEDFSNILKQIVVTFILHNICIDRNDDWINEHNSDDYTDPNEIVAPQIQTEDELRQRMKEYVLSKIR